MVGIGTIRARRSGEGGFTLVELMIVMAIIMILATIAIPIYVRTLQRAKEATLREDLHTMRTAIDSYTVDKEKAPETLDDLVQAGYLKSIPVDPMTSSNETWITGMSDTMTDINETQGGMDDVHSGSQALASDGTTYNTWCCRRAIGFSFARPGLLQCRAGVLVECEAFCWSSHACTDICGDGNALGSDGGGAAGNAGCGFGETRSGIGPNYGCPSGRAGEGCACGNSGRASGYAG